MSHAWRLMMVAGGLYGTAIGIVVIDPGDAAISLIIAGTASVIVGVAVSDMIHDRKEQHEQGRD